MKTYYAAFQLNGIIIHSIKEKEEYVWDWIIHQQFGDPESYSQAIMYRKKAEDNGFRVAQISIQEISKETISEEDMLLNVLLER